MNHIGIKILNEEVLKNGDTKYFAFLSFNKLKTYAFISKIQIDALKKDFNFINLEIPEKTSLYSKKTALATNKYVNVGLFYLLKEKPNQFSVYKKNKVLDLLLSDKPELFYKTKSNFSYREISKFRFYDFSFDKDLFLNKKRQDNSICFQIKDMETPHELAEFVFGDSSKQSKKMVMNLLLLKTKDDYRINYELVRTIFVLRKLFSLNFIYWIIENKTKELMKSMLFKDICYYPLNEDHVKSIKTYLNNFDSEKEKLRELLRFNIPHHVLNQFTEVMNLAYEQLKPNVKKGSDALYFFNNLSRDYGRLTLGNFDLNMIQNESYKKEVLALKDLSFGQFKFEIPKDYETLVKWGSVLCNCVGNYHTKESYENKLLIGVYKNDQLYYLISLKGSSFRHIEQFKGFKNSDPLKEDFNLIFDHLKPFLTNPDSNLKELPVK